MERILFLLLILQYAGSVYAQDSLAYLFSEEKIIRANDLDEGSAIYSADINQDGWLDILVGASRRPYSLLYLNDKKGSFLEAIPIDQENKYPGPASFLVLDYDGDSDVDIIIGYEWYGIHLYKNNGDHTFQSGVEIMFDDAVNMVANDIDGDGKLEIISSSGRGSYLRITHVIDSDSVVNKWVNVGYHYYSELIDMDLDGDKDIVYLDDDEVNFKWLENFGDSINTVPRSKNFGSHLREIYVRDTNDDGIDDLILKKNDGYRIYKHVSDTSFQFYKSLSSTGGVKEITIGDFDTDGESDIVYSKEGSSYNIDYIYYSKSSESGLIKIDDNISDLVGLESSDLNNDGLIDIIGVSGNDSFAFWYQNNGDGTFSDMKFISKGLYTPSGLNITDLNNDGKKEILAISGRQSRISYFQMLNDSVWKQTNIDTEADNSGNLATADFDNDGLKDLIYSSYLSDEVLWRQNMGNLTFSEPDVVDEVSRPRNVYTKDFNNDGSNDVLISTTWSDGYTGLRMAENDNNGGFTNRRHLGILFYYDDEHLLLEDIDGNGFVDLMTTNRYGFPMKVNYNLDGENFEEKTFSYVNDIYVEDPSDFYFEDVNGDGEKDILILHEKGEVSWMKLNANGSYFRTLIREAQSTNSLGKNKILMYDFDKDGDNDILLGDHSESKLLFMINVGGGNFVEGKHLSGMVRSNSEFDVADIDGDGDGDIIIVDTDGHEISWFENESKISTGNEEIVNQDYTIRLIGNYPNPFNPTTNFVFELDNSQEIHFKIFDLTGRKVAEISPRSYSSGKHEIEFNASNLSSGVYFYQMLGKDFIKNSRFTLIK